MSDLSVRCATAAEALHQGDATLAPAIVAHLGACTHCRSALASQRIQLTRQMLTLALPAPPALGPLRGQPPETIVIYDGTDGYPPRQLTITVEEESPETIALQVDVSPPLRGLLFMALGDQRYNAQLRRDSPVRFTNLPAQLLHDSAAPDLEICIFPIGPSSFD